MNIDTRIEETVSTVLVVDDTRENLHLLAALLRKRGYAVQTADSGDAALAMQHSFVPTLILLDIHMPGIDGYEVCKRVKTKDSPWRDVPIIFLTARSDPKDILRGFELGAVDYVLKPFNTAELMARVRTHVALTHSLETIRHQKESLEALNREKDEILGIVAHDLKNPLNLIMGTATVLSRPELVKKEELPVLATDILTSARRMFDLVSSLLDINAIEQGKLHVQPEIVDPALLAAQIGSAYRIIAERKEIPFAIHMEEGDLRLVTDPRILVQVLDNLVSNAIKYSPYGSPVTLAISQVKVSPPYVKFAVIDKGPGLSQEDQLRLFEKFAKLTPRPTADEHSTGLGLSIVKRLVETLNGRIYCTSTLGEGSTFAVELPVGNPVN